MNSYPDLILKNGRISALHGAPRDATSMAVKDGKILAIANAKSS